MTDYVFVYLSPSSKGRKEGEMERRRGGKVPPPHLPLSLPLSLLLLLSLSITLPLSLLLLSLSLLFLPSLPPLSFSFPLSSSHLSPPPSFPSSPMNTYYCTATMEDGLLMTSLTLSTQNQVHMVKSSICPYSS